MSQKSIEQEKLDWMKEVGMQEFERPMKYHAPHGHVYSEEYIRETPLEVLRARFATLHPSGDD